MLGRVSFLMQSSNFITGASAVSGFFASACSLPFDYVKTQIQKMQPDANGKYPYTGSLDCAMKTFKSGGPFKFYTGFPVYCVRIAPHVMVSKTGCNALFDNPFVYLIISLTDSGLWFTHWMTMFVQMTWIFLNQIQKFEKKIGI